MGLGLSSVGAGVGFASLGYAIASQEKKSSDNSDCSSHGGDLNGVAWRFHAAGKQCGTTAQETTIEGGLNTYFDSLGGQICSVHCVAQSHGGTYRGYLLLGPDNVNLTDYQCDSSVEFPKDQCGSGGEKDVP